MNSIRDHIEYHAFISHVQKEAGDVCNLIAKGLEERNLRVWIDMEAEQINVVGMMRGVAQSATFVIYATRSYLSRPYCCFELLVALELDKPILIIWEPEQNRNGFAEFKDFIQMVPDGYMSILDEEAIRWQRRQPYNLETFKRLESRLMYQMPLISWKPEDLAVWVERLGPRYKSYQKIFRDEQITGDDMIHGIYQERNLIELGVNDAHARKIINEWKKLVYDEAV